MIAASARLVSRATVEAVSFELPPSDPRYAAYWYPGDGYVDDIAADVYNWFDCRYQTGGPKNAWKSLEQITYSPNDTNDLGGVTNYLDNLNAGLVQQGKPTKGLILMEWGSVENDTTTPGTKAS